MPDAASPHVPRNMDAGDLMVGFLCSVHRGVGCSHVGMKHAMLYHWLFSHEIFVLIPSYLLQPWITELRNLLVFLAVYIRLYLVLSLVTGPLGPPCFAEARATKPRREEHGVHAGKSPRGRTNRPAPRVPTELRAPGSRTRDFHTPSSIKSSGRVLLFSPKAFVSTSPRPPACSDRSLQTR